MSKISELISEIASNQQLKKTAGTQTDGDIFKNALDNAMSAKNDISAPESSGKTQGLGEIRATGMNIIVESSPTLIADKTESLLSVMDKYAENLNDPSVSLKQLEPIAEQMKNQSESLLAQAENCQDSEIKDIASRSSVTANVEYFKFVRGDYI